jgi:hypothetical protein
MHALNETGWIDAGRVHTREHSTKRQIFAAPEMAAKYNKTQLRNLIDAAPEPTKLRVVKNPPAAG